MKKKRASYEIFVVFLVVTLTVVLAAGLYKNRIHVQKSDVLSRELAMLRSGLTFYYTVNKRYPEKLEALFNEAYDFGHGDVRHYLDKLPAELHGEVIDPFGNPYKYDVTTGWVSSSTAGYKHW